MDIEVVQTADGSLSLYNSTIKEHYHSLHGAKHESLYVFIKQGLERFLQINPNRNYPIRILEMGFGSGLNTLLTWQFADEHKIPISYTSLELYPISQEVINQLESNMEEGKDLSKLHKIIWESPTMVSNYFTLIKVQTDILDFTTDNRYQICFYDAFSPNKQPELWSDELFTKLYGLLDKPSLLTTYCAKGMVKRTLKSVGFEVVTTQGPIGKREMIVALKN